MFEGDFVEAKVGAQQGNDFNLRNNVIHVRERNIREGLAAAHSQIPDFDLHVKWNGVNASDFSAAAGNALDFGDNPAPDISLKRFRRYVPKPSQEADDARSPDEQQVSPPLAAESGDSGPCHRACTPALVDEEEPGTRTSLSDRRVCNQETKSSLTFSSVSNSRIFAETSASGTWPAPDCFSWGTNLSR
jgi:hypothetical protein